MKEVTLCLIPNLHDVNFGNLRYNEKIACRMFFIWFFFGVHAIERKFAFRVEH